VRDHWRKRRTTEDLDTVDERRLAYIPDFEDDLARRSQADLLRLALDRLDNAKRTVVDLFYLEECSVAEIARIQRKSISAVKMDLFRARRLLVKIVEGFAKKK
jgi:RNA polymerase sigma factor (sigma-70 family)